MLVNSGIDNIGEEVLNDSLVSIPTGSEHFLNKNKTSYEEELFKIEDLWYQYDQTIHTNQSIYEALEWVLAELENYD